MKPQVSINVWTGVAVNHGEETEKAGRSIFRDTYVDGRRRQRTFRHVISLPVRVVTTAYNLG